MFGQMVITEFVITYSCTNTDENSDDIPSIVAVKEVAMDPKVLIDFKRAVNGIDYHSESEEITGSIDT